MKEGLAPGLTHELSYAVTPEMRVRHFGTGVPYHLSCFLITTETLGGHPLHGFGRKQVGERISNLRGSNRHVVCGTTTG